MIANALSAYTANGLPAMNRYALALLASGATNLHVTRAGGLYTLRFDYPAGRPYP